MSWRRKADPVGCVAPGSVVDVNCVGSTVASGVLRLDYMDVVRDILNSDLLLSPRTYGEAMDLAEKDWKGARRYFWRLRWILAWRWRRCARMWEKAALELPVYIEPKTIHFERFRALSYNGAS